jgi:hypothetical protein
LFDATLFNHLFYAIFGYIYTNTCCHFTTKIQKILKSRSFVT